MILLVANVGNRSSASDINALYRSERVAAMECGDCVCFLDAFFTTSQTKLETVCLLSYHVMRGKSCFPRVRWNCAYLNVRFEDLSMTRLLIFTY